MESLSIFLSDIILGLVQGLTEFLPVSSSGHLIIARDILNVEVEYGLAYDALLHFATAFAVLFYFRKDFCRLLIALLSWVKRRHILYEDRQLLLALFAGTIPAVVAGLLLENYIEVFLRGTLLVAFALVMGSFIFVIAEYALLRRTKRISSDRTFENPHSSEKRDLGLKGGFVIGLFQALALIPGMSRSGMAISGGMLFGLSRRDAARFAFLLSLPIILGAGGKSALSLGAQGLFSDIGLSLFLSAVVAFFSGIFAIHYMLKYLQSHSLYVFVAYRLLLAGALFVFLI